MRRAVAVATLAVLALAGCGTAEEPHGQVTQKEHKLATTTWKTVPKTKRVCESKTTGSGKSKRTKQSCKTINVGTKRVPHRTPECWQIELNHDEHELCVSKEEYDAVKVGDDW